jgi:hypothetical protein
MINDHATPLPPFYPTIIIRLNNSGAYTYPKWCAVKATVAGAVFKGVTVLNGKLILGDATSSQMYACDIDYTAGRTAALTAVTNCAALAPTPTVPTSPLAVAGAAV